MDKKDWKDLDIEQLRPICFGIVAVITNSTIGMPNRVSFNDLLNAVINFDKKEQFINLIEMYNDLQVKESNQLIANSVRSKLKY